MTNTLKTYSMRKIYLIRHCLAKCPGGKRICLGQTDVPLGKEGRLQAVELKKCFKSIPYTAVFTSPLLRAYETAVYLGDPVVINSLKEAGAGDWDGLSFDEITEKWPELYVARGKDPNIPIPGAEDINLVRERMTGAVRKALDSSEGDICIVSHATAMKAFLSYISDMPAGRCRDIKIGSAEVITLEAVRTGDGWDISFGGKTKHI